MKNVIAGAIAGAALWFGGRALGFAPGTVLAVVIGTTVFLVLVAWWMAAKLPPQSPVEPDREAYDRSALGQDDYPWGTR